MSEAERVDATLVLKYIGSKRRMASTLDKFIDADCTTLVEPFAGSAALTVYCSFGNKRFERMVLNELNSDIANFWRVASDPVLGVQLLEALKQTRYSRTLFEQAKQRREDFGGNRSDLVAWAVDTYILNHQSFNALGDYWHEGDPVAYMNHITQKPYLPLTLKYLQERPIEVYNENALTLLEESGVLDDEKAFIYLDPPYMEGLRCNGKLYQTDMPGVCDHIDLLNLIKTAKAKILLSGYWSGRDDGTDLYDAYLLPHGWHRHCLGGFTKSCQSGTEHKDTGTEYLWTSFAVEEAMQNALRAEGVNVNAEQKSPCLMRWLAVQFQSPEGGGLV